MKLINAEKVSHISVIGEKQGVWSTYKGWIKMTHLPYRKHTFWEFDKETVEGWYENGEVYTHPQILIYLGKDLLHKQYFITFEELENHLKENYPNVNIKYE